LRLPATGATGEYREVASRKRVNEISDGSGFEDSIRKSPQVVHAEAFMQGGGVEISVDNAH
jgi:hypothetical protein